MSRSRNNFQQGNSSRRKKTQLEIPDFIPRAHVSPVCVCPRADASGGRDKARSNCDADVKHLMRFRLHWQYLALPLPVGLLSLS